MTSNASGSLLFLFACCNHQWWLWRSADREGEGQRRDILEGDQRCHGLDQLGTGEGWRLWDHQLHHPKVFPYSRDQDC